jgi:hypothetical protein
MKLRTRRVWSGETYDLAEVVAVVSTVLARVRLQQQRGVERREVKKRIEAASALPPPLPSRLLSAFVLALGSAVHLRRARPAADAGSASFFDILLLSNFETETSLLFHKQTETMDGGSHVILVVEYRPLQASKPCLLFPPFPPPPVLLPPSSQCPLLLPATTPTSRRHRGGRIE